MEMLVHVAFRVMHLDVGQQVAISRHGNLFCQVISALSLDEIFNVRPAQPKFSNHQIRLIIRVYFGKSRVLFHGED